MTLPGKKTYITAAVMALVTFARAMGWLDDQAYAALEGLLAALGLATLRAGVSKASQ
jgi:hypothetical protein